MVKRLLFLLAVLATPILAVPSSALAVEVFDRDVCGSDNVKSLPADEKPAVCQDKNLPKNPDGSTQNPLFGPDGVLTAVINILSAIVAIVALIMILLGGLKYITSGTNPQDLTKAREMIIYAVVGLVLAGLAQALVRLIIGKVDII